MRYLLWIDEKASAPMDRAEVLSMYSRGAITKGTLACEEGGNAWRALGEVASIFEPPAPAQPLAEREVITGRLDIRGAGWISAFRVLGILSLVCSALVGIATVSEGGQAWSVVPLVAGGVWCLFMAFATELACDARELLRQIRDKR